MRVIQTMIIVLIISFYWSCSEEEQPAQVSSDLGGSDHGGIAEREELGGMILMAGMEGGATSMGGHTEDCVGDQVQFADDTITGEVTWSCGTYEINRTITIENGSLYIEACVVLKMGMESKINVKQDGQLIIEGQMNCPVQFTSQQMNPVKGSWGGIRIFEGGRAQINHALMEYGGIRVREVSLF